MCGFFTGSAFFTIVVVVVLTAAHPVKEWRQE
jgi:hypothetical protein